MTPIPIPIPIPMPMPMPMPMPGNRPLLLADRRVWR